MNKAELEARVLTLERVVLYLVRNTEHWDDAEDLIEHLKQVAPEDPALKFFAEHWSRELKGVGPITTEELEADLERRSQQKIEIFGPAAP